MALPGTVSVQIKFFEAEDNIFPYSHDVNANQMYQYILPLMPELFRMSERTLFLESSRHGLNPFPQLTIPMISPVVRK
jgi:hypothetical protein